MMKVKFEAFCRVGRKMKPTLKHRPVITGGILGTVYAISPEGEVKYFDYKWDEALEFAGVDGTVPLQDLDIRFGKADWPRYLPGHDMWHPERKVDGKAWWVRDPS